MILTMSEKSSVQMLLEKRFQQLAQEQRENNEVPAELRHEIFRTLGSIDVLSDVTDLHNSNSGEATARFLDVIEQLEKAIILPADQVDN